MDLGLWLLTLINLKGDFYTSVHKFTISVSSLSQSFIKLSKHSQKLITCSEWKRIFLLFKFWLWSKLERESTSFHQQGVYAQWYQVRVAPVHLHLKVLWAHPFGITPRSFWRDYICSFSVKAPLHLRDSNRKWHSPLQPDFGKAEFKKQSELMQLVKRYFIFLHL